MSDDVLFLIFFKWLKPDNRKTQKFINQLLSTFSNSTFLFFCCHQSIRFVVLYFSNFGKSKQKSERYY